MDKKDSSNKESKNFIVPKFKIGQKAWSICDMDRKVYSCKVCSTDIMIKNTAMIVYTVECDEYGSHLVDERDLFKTKKEAEEEFKRLWGEENE